MAAGARGNLATVEHLIVIIARPQNRPEDTKDQILENNPHPIDSGA
jgi:hypothetical protein